MRIMRRLTAALLMMTLLIQVFPLKALADTGDPITQTELEQALKIAGLRVATAEGQAAQDLSVSNGVPGASSDELVRIEPEESGYHNGMNPDETWDAQMFLDWLDELIKTDAYYVNHSFSQINTILDDLEKQEPVTYGRLTGNAKYAEYQENCRTYAMTSEAISEQANLFRNRLQEYTAVIQQNTETLLNCKDTLFDFEISRLSEQIREATEQLDLLAEDILAFYIAQVLMLIYGKLELDGSADPEFSAWMKEVLATVDEPEIRTGSLSDAPVGVTASNNTRLTRMAAANNTRVLAGDSSKDFTIMVLDQTEFAITIQGKDNQPLVGVEVTLTDLNGSNSKTVYTKDPKFGIATFNTKDFVCDSDQEMELALTVDGTALGYRKFYIPWMIMRQGGHRTETLKLLSDPDEGETAVKPYVYSCTFNDMDIVRSDKVITISELNDNTFDFAITVENPSKLSYTPPVLHYWTYSSKSLTDSVKEITAKPTSTEKISATRTKYIYSGKWKQTLSPDVSKKQWPYFVFPDTGEKVTTKACPQRSKIDQPSTADTGMNSPLRKVFGQGFSLSVKIPKIGGNLGIELPFEKYLPKVAVDPFGYLIVNYGTSLTDPKKTEWKNAEQERYDKGMKQYQHESYFAGQKQKLGTAQKYYKYMGDANQKMMTAKVNLGWYLMLSGKWEKDDPDDHTTYWNASGTAGLTFLFSFDLTKPFTIGPVPLYANVNFSASVGFGTGLQVKVLMNKDHSFRDFQFDFGGLTVEIRLALTVSLGIGIKGIASAWVSASGALNIVIQFMLRQPIHVAVFAEFNVAVGFQLFFISYSRTLWTSPKLEIYNSDKKGFGDVFRLLMAYAEADEASGQEPDTVQLEPERYSQLAPKARAAVAYRNLASAGIKTVEHKGKTYAFFIENGFMADNVKKAWRLNLCDLEHAATFYDPLFKDWEESSFKAQGLSVDDYEDYDFDIYSDGEQIHIILTCASRFDEEGNPLPGTLDNGKPNIVFVYMTMTDVELPDFSIQKCLVYPWKPTWQNGISPVCTLPHIESCIVRNGEREIYGTLKGQNQNVEESQYNLFYILPEEETIEMYGDCTVGGNYGNDYIRANLRSAMRNGDVNLKSPDPSSFPSLSFVALDTPREGESGDSYLILYDYYMSTFGVTEIYDDRPDTVYTPVDTKRRPVVLAQGDIDSFEMIQSLTNDSKSYTQTIFYTQKETVGERTENRLKGIYLAPRKWDGLRGVEYEATYVDYDLSIPASDFRAVTIGVSQYLYWLETAPREKETDPDTYRITGVYYDAATGALSDRIVMAEFSIPQNFTWVWDNRKWNFVPVNVMLTGNGTGYVEARPKVTDEGYTKYTPLNLYSFPLTLKTVADIRGISLMENVVTQGEFAAADLTIMNSGNMGIGSFEMEVILMENGVEKETVETLYANLLYPADSKIVMKDGSVAAQGEAAIFRYKDLAYSVRQSEWIIRQKNKNYKINHGTLAAVTDGSDKSNRIVNNVLAPGALGGFNGNIKIPNNWHGRYELRVKVKSISAYSNYIHASRVAQEYPALFAHDLSAPMMLASAGGSGVAGMSRYTQLSKLGVQRLDYALDEEKGKMVLKKESMPAMIMASAAGVPSMDPEQRNILAAGIAGDETASDEDILLYATEVEAPKPVNFTLNVHDIDVSHRVYDNYHGEEMLEITIHNYYNNNQAIRLYCMVYDDDSEIGRNYNLPHDQETISAGKTQTITVPLSSMVDADKHEKIRVVIKGIGINDETATFNNEFTVYLGGKAEEPEPTAAPTVVPKTGDSGQPVLWIALILLGTVCLLITGGLFAIRKKKGRNGGADGSPDRP